MEQWVQSTYQGKKMCAGRFGHDYLVVHDFWGWLAKSGNKPTQPFNTCREAHEYIAREMLKDAIIKGMK